jgi:hypothetical protein
MTRRRYQNGSLTKKSNRFSEDVWQFRFYETTPEGRRYRKSTSVGTVAQYPFAGLSQIPGANLAGSKPEVSTNAGRRSREAFGRAGRPDFSSNSVST